MRTTFFVCIALTSFFLWNCSNQSNDSRVRNSEKQSNQLDDGSILLKLDKAGYYHDADNPSNNTAEWNVEISQPGRFKVWLSSATKDTVKLNYPSNVRVNLPDGQLVGIPACNKIIQKSEDVSYPYYRADSYMGSVYFPEPGKYNIQVVSSMVVSKASESKSASQSGNTKLMGVILTPVLR
jgi:hypothetical protein